MPRRCPNWTQWPYFTPGRWPQFTLGLTDGTAPVNAALDSIMDLAVQLPVLKKIGKSVGMHFDNGLAGVLEEDEDSIGKS